MSQRMNNFIKKETEKAATLANQTSGGIASLDEVDVSGGTVSPADITQGFARIVSTVGKFEIKSMSFIAPVFELTGLQAVGTELRIDSSKMLKTLSFPELHTVGTSLDIHGNVALETLSFPELRTVGTYLDISSNTAIKTLSFPELRTIGTSLDINSNAALETLSFAKLVTTGSYIYIHSNPQLRTISFPSISRVGIAGSGYLYLQNNGPDKIVGSVGGSCATLKAACKAVTTCASNTKSKSTLANYGVYYGCK